MTEKEFKTIHGHTFDNRSEIEQSIQCGCIACCEQFPKEEVDEYIDDNQTALCPKCSIDAVIGDAAGYELSHNFLAELNKKFFG